MARRKAKKHGIVRRVHGYLQRLDKLTHQPGRTKAARKAWAARARAAKHNKGRFIGPRRQCCPKGATGGLTEAGRWVCTTPKGKRVPKLKKCPTRRS